MPKHTVQEFIDVMERRKRDDKKYRLKIAYRTGNKEKEYAFNINQAIIDNKNSNR